MRRLLSLLLLPTLLLTLSGCGGLAAGRREVEQLQVMETLGVDRVPGGLQVSLAPAAGEGPCLSAEGVSVPAALERLRELSVEEEVFCGHVRRLLVGEEAAREDLKGLLDFICRSPDLRLDMPVYVLRGTTAAAAMRGTGGESADVDQVMRSLQTRLARRHEGEGFTAARALRDLERSGSTLLYALDCRPAAEENTGTAAPDGFAVIHGGKLQRFIEQDQVLGVSFLLNRVGVDRLTVQDLGGLPATLEVVGGSLQVRPLWKEDGSLRGLELLARVRCSLLDKPEPGEASREQYADYLTGQMETAVSRRISQVLQLSKQMKADFAGLGARLELAAPEACRGMSRDLGELLPELELSISVRGELAQFGDTD